MDLKKLAFSLTLSASVFAGCGDDSGGTATTPTTPTTPTTQLLVDVGTCSDAGTPVLYRLNVLHIPTSAEAEANGAAVGHNIDNAGTSCGIPDYAGGVDNSLIDLANALPGLTPTGGDPINLQTEIDTGLNCAVGATDCSRIDLIVSIATGTQCVRVSVEDVDGTALTPSFVGSLDSAGVMRGQAAMLMLSIPYNTETGPVPINLAVTSVIITGTATPTTLSNVVIGGALARTAFETTIMNLLPLLGGEIEFSAIAPILSSLYDVQDSTGACSALSVGLSASGVLYTPPAP